MPGATQEQIEKTLPASCGPRLGILNALAFYAQPCCSKLPQSSPIATMTFIAILMESD